jgi:hypothetical protein
MARGPAVTDEIRILIAQTYLAHPNWKKTEIRNWISSELHNKNSNLPSSFPSLRIVYKVIAQIVYNEEEPDPQNKPWSLGSLEQYPLSSEVIPTVLKIWKLKDERGETFSVREAKWAGRLAKIERFDNDISRLIHFITIYSNIERIYTLLGFPFNSDALDRTLMGIHEPYNPVDNNKPIRTFEELKNDVMEISKRIMQQRSKKYKLEKGYLVTLKGKRGKRG